MQRFGDGSLYSTSYTEDFIREFYTKIDVLKPQQLQFQVIASKLGVNVFYWPESSQALFMRQIPYIFINKHLSQQQQWQNFCHELAHVLLHTGNQRQMTSSFREYQEARANLFMYHACVPTFMLQQLNIDDYSAETVLLIQKLFNVEKEFALYRLTQYINKKHFMLNLHSLNS